MNNSNNIQRYSSFSKAFSSIAFLLISSYSYSQTYTDYYFIPTTGGNATLNLAENYTVGSPDGGVASEIPGHNTNVFISANADGYTANTNYHNFNAHNVTFKVGDAGTGASGAWFCSQKTIRLQLRAISFFPRGMPLNGAKSRAG